MFICPVEMLSSGKDGTSRIAQRIEENDIGIVEGWHIAGW
jgi:hypothetical protein